MTKILIVSATILFATLAHAGGDFIVRLEPNASLTMFSDAQKTEPLGGGWYRVQDESMNLESLRSLDGIEYAQPNFPLQLLHDFRVKNPALRQELKRHAGFQVDAGRAADPAVQPIPIQTQSATDPMFEQQWGMKNIGITPQTPSAQKVIVGVIDTGVDYNHEDLAPNMWRNPREQGTDSQGRDKATNGVDDDANGYIDDVVGWDFAANDNLPFDITLGTIQIATVGGNPGHGTHCAGNIGAKAGNSVGIRGVAGDVQIMALRFINEKGSGDTASAIKAIRYGVDNGAKVLSNSWGSIGEDPKESAENEALREAIRYANSKGVLFVAAAGNGHMGKGYDNDIDARPTYPVSYKIDNIVGVAALDSNDKLGKFSNWGKTTVHVGAPGVNVYSTVPGKEKYTNKAVKIFGMTAATWDGTSMAAPHVAGAAALYWSQNPTATVQQVKEALIESATKIPALDGKVVSDGKLNVGRLLKLK